MKPKKLSFLVLSAVSQPQLSKAIDQAGHTWERVPASEFSMFINDQGRDEIWRNGEPIADTKYDAVIPRLGKDRKHGSRLLRHFSENLGAWVLQTGRALDLVSDKFRTSQLLSSKNIPTPKQFLCKSIGEDFDAIISKLGGYPIICKPVGGSQGRGIMILETPLSASHVIEYLLAGQTQFILQSFIETRTETTGGTDLRIIVCDNKVVSCMKRTAPSGKVRANLSIDASGEPFEPSKEIKQLAIDATAAVDGLNFCGCDVMIDHRTNKAYIVELNGNAGNRIIGITNKNHFDEVVGYAVAETTQFRSDEAFAVVNFAQEAAPETRSNWEAKKAAKRQIEDKARQYRNSVSECKGLISQIEKLPDNEKNIHYRHLYNKYGMSVFQAAKVSYDTQKI